MPNPARGNAHSTAFFSHTIWQLPHSRQPSKENVMRSSLNLKQSAGHTYKQGCCSHVLHISSLIWMWRSLSMSYLLTANLSSTVFGFITISLFGKDHGSSVKGKFFPSVNHGTVSKISFSACHRLRKSFQPIRRPAQDTGGRIEDSPAGEEFF